MQAKESIDLMNVEYEDVLHLYRGWRKSESALKDKDKELSTMKNRINQLQDSHNRFRGQIQALESVKELTVSLQTQVTALQQENRQLIEENKELASLNIKAEEIIKEKEDVERQQARMLKNVQLEFATLSGRYEETLKAQKELERIAQGERASRMALDSRLSSSDKNTQTLAEENNKLRHQLEVAQLKLNQCDQELLHASEQLASITKEVVNISTTKSALANAEAEVSILKGDIARVIRLFEALPGSREFFHHWTDSSDMSFAGMEYSEAYDDDEGEYHPAHPSLINSFSESQTALGGRKKMTETEFAHLKRVHGKDPFPLTANLTDEAEFWVPSEAARLGVQFMASKFPNTPPKVIMDFLRTMNKIWLRRERRKVKRVKEVLGADVEDLRRQLSNQKPYKGVLAERQIRRLKSQVMTDRKKHLSGRARSKLESATLDEDTKFERQAGRTYFAVEDMEAEELGGHSRRFCKTEQLRRSMEGQSTEAATVASAKLLQASLSSLDNLTLRQSQISLRDEEGGGVSLRKMSREATEDSDASYPSASYLRGALWLGRNLTLISEELNLAMDQVRMRTLEDIQQVEASHEGALSQAELLSELKRGVHRLKILATGAATHACTLSAKSKVMARNILQGATDLQPGNADQFQRFLATLPIESALIRPASSAPASPHRTTSRPASPGNRSVSMRMSSLLDSPLYTADLTNKSRDFM